MFQRAYRLRVSLAGGLTLCCALPLLGADADFFKLFPASPVISILSYSGQTAYTQTYTPSGSTWASGLNETEVFFASLKHTESADNSWETRIGKGGQLYSIRGPMGESQPPQAQPNAHWIDQIFQLVGVNRALNLSTPNHAYFVHQAGDYLDDPILTSTFYSPMLASSFDPTSNAAFALSWGQQAHIPNVNPAGLLYYERVKDLGSGVIEVTYVIYNFGPDVIDYQDTPWGGVRKSVLPVTLASNPDGSFKTVTGLWGAAVPNLLNLKNTGGWIAWTQNAANTSSPTLALVLGKDTVPMPSYQSAPARFAWGTAAAVDDFEVVEVTPFVNQAPGSAYYFRVYLVSGTLSNVQTLANSLAPSAAKGPVVFTEDNADLEAVYTQTAANGQTILTTTPTAGQQPAFYTYAEPVANSLPLFVLKSTSTGSLRLSTNPCELCTQVVTTNGTILKPYDGTVQYVGFLGYVLPAQYQKSKAPIYESMLNLVTDRIYFPASALNQTLQVVAGRVNITSVNVAGGGTGIAQNTWIEIRGAQLAPNADAAGLSWGSAPDFASGKMPTQLGGVSVTVNGKPAYINYVSPGQVNVLTPLDTTLGSVNIQLTAGVNTTTPYTATMQTVAPSFFLFGSTSYVAATHADGTPVGPASMSVPGYPFSPAQPNETVVLWGNGCGLPSTPLVQGSASQSGALSAAPVITVGGVPATVAYAGLSGPGLCQVNVTVPSSAVDGDNAVVAAFGTSKTPLGTLIAVQH
jgi:uncharacterized protein (TIGR03437 family)